MNTPYACIFRSVFCRCVPNPGLDPLRRESYASLDVYGVLELISPGLVRVKLENAHLCHFSTISLLTY